MGAAEALLGEGWQREKVIAVTFPVPTLSAKGVVYAEDCWSSNALEMAADIFTEKEGVVLGSAFTDRGPAFAIQYSLCDLVSLTDCCEKFISVCAKSIYCATVGYKKLFETKKTAWATEANIEGLSLGSSSCHPGSHTAIPLSPILTTILQLKRLVELTNNRQLPERFKTFADDESSAKYFPQIDFTENVRATKAFNTIATSHILSHSANALAGLSQRLVLEAIPKMNTNSVLWKKFNNNAVKIKQVVSNI